MINDPPPGNPFSSPPSLSLLHQQTLVCRDMSTPVVHCCIIGAHLLHSSRFASAAANHLIEVSPRNASSNPFSCFFACFSLTRHPSPLLFSSTTPPGGRMLCRVMRPFFERQRQPRGAEINGRRDDIYIILHMKTSCYLA